MRKTLYRILSMVLCASIVFAILQIPILTNAESMLTSFGEVWSAPTTVKILRNETDYSKKGDAKLEYEMVRNEYESYQLFITATTDVDSFELQTADLHNGNEILSADNVDVYVQKYVYYNDTCGEGYAPDPLIPMEAAVSHGENKIVSGNNGALWVTVYVPKNTVAGTYSGTFKLIVDSGSKIYQQDIPVSVKVYDYTLTDNVNAETLFSWRYQQVASGEQDGSAEMMSYYYEFFQDYRISLQSLPVEALTGEEYIENVLKYYDRLTSYTILTHAGNISGTLDSNPAIMKEQILAVAAACTVDRNLFDKAIIYFVDEPKLQETTVREKVIKRIGVLNGYLQECIDIIAADNTGLYDGLKQLANWEESILDIPNVIPVHDLPIQWMINNENSEEGQELLNALNCICPIYYNFYDGTREKLTALCQKYEIELWWYGCVVSETPYPTYFVGDTNLLSCRNVSWLQKKYDVVGNLYWDIAGYTLDEPYGYDPQLFEWPDRDKNGNLQAGDGNLVYPGAKYGVYGPLPSMRLMSIRDGMEEYELLRDLENFYEQSKASLGNGFSVDAAMEALYSCLDEKGIKMCADGENGLDFITLRKNLLQLIEGKDNGLIYGISNISYSGNQYTGFYANFTCYVPTGTTLTVTGGQISAQSGNAYTVESNKMSGDTYITISVSKNNQTMSYTQYVGTKTSWLSTLATTSETDEVASNTQTYSAPVSETRTSDSNVLFAFESYEEIAGAHVLLGNQFGKTSINQEGQFVKEGVASWRVEPQGNYSQTDGYPFFKFYCSDSDSTLKQRFSEYDKILMDIYNDSNEDVRIRWDLIMSNAQGEKVTARTICILKANAWNTCEFWFTGEEFKNDYCLNTVEAMQVTFLNRKLSKDDSVDVLYIDNLRGEKFSEYLDVSEYRSDTSYKYPQKGGYVFAGWYKDAELSEPWGKVINEEKAYAKFVDAGALTVKFQLTAGVSLDDPVLDLRILTSVDSLYYQSVGFEIAIDGQVQSYSTKNVYSIIQGSENGQQYTYEPTVFSKESAYFGALTIANIPNRVFDTVMSVTPVWTTMDGTVVRGECRETTMKALLESAIVLQNPEGADRVSYIFNKPAKQGQIVTFNLDVTPVQDVSVWLYGLDSEGKSLGEWFALQYAEGVSKQTIAVEMKEDVTSFRIAVKFNDSTVDVTKYVTTISNVTVRDSGIITNADGSMTVYNGSGSKNVKVPIATGDFQVGDIVSFDIDFNMDEVLAIYVRGRDADGTLLTGERMHAAQYTWNGKKTITAKPIDCEGVKIIEVHIQYRKVTSEISDGFKDNVATISNVKINTVTITNPSGAKTVSHTFNKEVKQGQIVTFDLDVTPVQDVSVWLIGLDSEGTSLGEWFALQYANGVTNKTIAVEMKADAPSFKIKVQYNATQDRTQNVTTISNVTVRDSGIITNADESLTVYNGSGSRNVRVPIATGDFQVGDIVSFDIDFNMDEVLAIYVRGRDAEGTLLTGERMHAAEYTWDGKKTITANPIDCEGVKIIEVHIQYRKVAYEISHGFKDNVATISNIKIE